MMSMGCNMFPMMFPRVHQFVPPPMGMAVPMGMNMGLGMGTLAGPMPPFLPVLSGSHMARASAAPLSQGPPPMQPFQAFFGHVAPQAGKTDPALPHPAAPNLANRVDPPRQQHAGLPHLEGHPQVRGKGAVHVLVYLSPFPCLFIHTWEEDHGIKMIGALTFRVLSAPWTEGGGVSVRLSVPISMVLSTPGEKITG